MACAENQTLLQFVSSCSQILCFIEHSTIKEV